MDSVYELAFSDELEKIAKKKKSKLKKALTVGGSALAGVGAAALGVSAFRKKPGAIYKAFGKKLTPRMWHFSEEGSKKVTIKEPLERWAMKGWKPKPGGEIGEGIGDLKKGEVGFAHGIGESLLERQKTPYINNPSKILTEDILDKYKYGKELHKKGLGAKTWRLPMKDVDTIYDKRKPGNVIKFLDKKHGKGKYIYKPRMDDWDDLGATGGTNSLIRSEGTKKKNLKAFKQEAHNFIGQEKLDIKKEYRVRTVNGKMIAALDRYPSKTSQNILHRTGLLKKDKMGIGVIPKQTMFGEGRALRKFVEKNQKSFNPGGGKGKVNTVGFDVASVKGKGGKREFKIIEANPYSGADLNNPYVSSKVLKELTGEATKGEKIIKGTAAAGLGTVAATPVVKGVIARKKKKKKAIAAAPKKKG